MPVVNRGRVTLNVRRVDIGSDMTITQALQTLTDELIESHARCHYPYILSSSACTVGNPPDIEAGVCIMIHSDVFGRIASADAPTWREAVIAVCDELIRTRASRWKAEVKFMR